MKKQFVYIIFDDYSHDAIGAFTKKSDTLNCLKDLEIQYHRNMLKKNSKLHLKESVDDYGNIFFRVVNQNGRTDLSKDEGNAYYYDKIPLNNIKAVVKEGLIV